MLNSMGNGLLGVVVVGPAALAALAFAFGNRAPRRFAQAGAVVAGAGFMAAVAMAVVSGHDPVTATIAGADFSVDRLSAFLLLLIFGVSAIVQAFAVRYLAGDPRQGWFVGGAGVLTAASGGLATAGTLVALAVCWTLAGVALCLLLATYWHLPAARDGVRRTAIAFLIGDLALWAAVAAATASFGRVDLRGGAAQLGGGGAQLGGALVPVLGVLVVIAALSRSAQLPFQRWLPATLAAPTPVSALLHAGVVNAGAILLIRLWPLSGSGAAQALTIVAGGATMVYGATIMLVKPDVKGALAHSTTAQMGFMILTCGLGLWAAAVIHLFAHGFYKATLFLSSGSAVGARLRGAELPPAPVLTPGARVLNIGAAVLIPAVALAAAVAVVPAGSGDHAAEQALLAFALVTGAAATWGWLRRRTGVASIAKALVFLIPAAIGYLAIITAAGSFLAPALPASPLPAQAVWLATALVLVLLGGLAAVRSVPGADRVRRALYAGALNAGHIQTPHSTVLTGARS